MCCHGYKVWVSMKFIRGNRLDNYIQTTTEKYAIKEGTTNVD